MMLLYEAQSSDSSLYRAQAELSAKHRQVQMTRPQVMWLTATWVTTHYKQEAMSAMIAKSRNVHNEMAIITACKRLLPISEINFAMQ